MPILTFALDEDVAHPLANLLRSLGLVADSAKELSRLGFTDPQVLLHAAAHKQTLITHNRNDFRALHEAWVTWRRRWEREVENRIGRPLALSQHAGILIVPPIPYQNLALILEEFEDRAGTMEDRLFEWTRVRGWHELRS